MYSLHSALFLLLTSNWIGYLRIYLKKQNNTNSTIDASSSSLSSMMKGNTLLGETRRAQPPLKDSPLRSLLRRRFTVKCEIISLRTGVLSYSSKTRSHSVSLIIYSQRPKNLTERRREIIVALAPFVVVVVAIVALFISF